jgi:hypothetical protein
MNKIKMAAHRRLRDNAELKSQRLLNEWKERINNGRK